MVYVMALAGFPGVKPTMKKALLMLLVIICSALAVWCAYLLFDNQTDPLWGWIVLAASIGVLFWSISVSRAYRVRPGPVVGVLVASALVAATVSALAGIEPFAGLKDRWVDSFAGVTAKYDVRILPGELSAIDGWAVSLNGGGWKGGTLTVDLTIVNLGPRRNFGYDLYPHGPELAAIDSTGKVVGPRRSGFLSFPYTKEFYPNESWSGSLKFDMSPYSGKTELYMTRGPFHRYKFFLFDVGEPRR